MTPAPLSPHEARRVFLLLTFTRWFPVGLTTSVMVLYQLDRGLSVAQVLTISSIAAVTVMLLELPTSSFSDGFGRRPVYVAAAIAYVLTAGVYLMADSFVVFAVGACLMGVFRALDSGPLEAWFVDTVHLSEPGADVDGALAKQGTILGAAIASGALLSGGLVWWHPIDSISALTLPITVFGALTVVHLCAVVILMREHSDQPTTSRVSRALESAQNAPSIVREGLGLLRSNKILRGLVLVEVFWAIGMVVFEQFQPIRLAELLGDEAQAGTWMGPLAAVGWAVFGLGSALSGITSRRIGVARTAILARLLNGLGAIVMGLVVGPAALVVAYLATYAMHGSAGPVHGALLHREASARNRATLLSINSMMSFAALAVAAPLLGLLAVSSSNQAAMVTAGAISLIGAFFYLPALRHERASRPS